ncbi:hypothetical protein [Arachnia propionica]|jgi:pullulanase, type I|uniref:hypothetical protein n=1 Tax=Arachnia propionica TaxID=1750 RepID=UPI000F6E9387|nr:hypothetical protein [Arachnia propionica]VEJ59044.1 Uncharacterised protein [Arachnia propionica]
MRKRILVGISVLGLGLGTLTAPAARAEGSATLNLHAVGAKADGTSPVWLGGRCSGNASGAVLRFFADKMPEPEGGEERTAETKVPEDESGETPNLEKEVAVTLKSDGTFEYIYDATSLQYVVATCKYSDGEAVSKGVVVDPDQPTEPTITATSDQQGFQPGGTIKVSLKGFAPNQEFEVYMHSKPVRIGTGTTNSDGSADVDAKIPDDATPGKHHLTVRAKNAQQAIFSFILKNKSGAKNDASATEGSAQSGSGQRGKAWKTGGQMPAKRVALKPGLPRTGH